MNAASSSTERIEGRETLPKKKKKKKKKAAPPPPPPLHKKKALVLPAAVKPKSRSNSSEVGAIIHAAARGNTKSDAKSKLVLPKTTKGSQDTGARSNSGPTFNELIHNVSDRLCHSEVASRVTGSHGADPVQAHLGARLPVTQTAPSKASAATLEKKKKRPAPPPPPSTRKVAAMPEKKKKKAPPPPPTTRKVAATSRKKKTKAPPPPPSTRKVAVAPPPPAPSQRKRKKKAAAPPPRSFKSVAETVRARMKVVNAFRVLSLGDREEQVLNQDNAKDIVERAAVAEENWRVVELSVQRKHIRGQLEDIIARRDPAKMLVVDKLMAQFDCKEISFGAIFAMMKVKVEHSYPGECLTRHPEDGAAPAPAAPGAEKKKEKNAPAPPPPAPTKAETAKDSTKAQPANDDAGAEAKTSALDRFRKAGLEARTRALDKFRKAAKAVALRLRIVNAFSSALNTPAADEEDVEEKIVDAGATTELKCVQEEQADAASVKKGMGWDNTLEALHRQHVQAQLIDILTRRAPQKLPVVPALMSQFDSPGIHYLAIFAMLKVKIEHSFPGEVLTDKLPTTKETEKLPDLST